MSVNDYIARLEQQLRQRGITDPRSLAEAREHLVDAIEDGRGRGLPVADAEHEAFERFGTPEIVAAHILEERGRMKTSARAAFAAFWERRWWILVPTVLAAMVTGVTSDFQPVRYRSQATILVVPHRVPDDYVRSSVVAKLEEQLRSINLQIRSRTHLERIIEDFNLYPERRKKDTMQEIVDDMSNAIDIEILHGGDIFCVAFTSDNARTAMQVTDRLAAELVDEHLKNRISRNTLVSSASVAANLERRQVGEQFRILDAARLPEQPVGPSRLRAALMGALVGFATGLLFVILRRNSNTNTRPPALAEA